MILVVRGTKSISGIKLRLEQELGRIKLGSNAMYLTLNADSQYDKVRKRQNSIGLSLKCNLNERAQTLKLHSRMTDTAVREAEVITRSYQSQPRN